VIEDIVKENNSSQRVGVVVSAPVVGEKDLVAEVSVEVSAPVVEVSVEVSAPVVGVSAPVVAVSAPVVGVSAPVVEVNVLVNVGLGQDSADTSIFASKSPGLSHIPKSGQHRGLLL
jgi:hypothetical protein